MKRITITVYAILSIYMAVEKTKVNINEYAGEWIR